MHPCSAANLAGGAPGTITRPQCGRGGIGRRDGLDANLSALPGNRRCRTAQIRGNLSNGNPEPSPAGGREGVETRRAAPKAFGQGEGIVQTTNPASSGVAKAAAGKKIRLPQGSGGSSPPARTKPPRRSDLPRAGVSQGAHVEPDRPDVGNSALTNSGFGGSKSETRALEQPGADRGIGSADAWRRSLQSFVGDARSRESRIRHFFGDRVFARSVSSFMHEGTTRRRFRSCNLNPVLWRMHGRCVSTSAIGSAIRLNNRPVLGSAPIGHAPGENGSLPGSLTCRAPRWN